MHQCYRTAEESIYVNVSLLKLAFLENRATHAPILILLTPASCQNVVVLMAPPSKAGRGATPVFFYCRNSGAMRARRASKIKWHPADARCADKYKNAISAAPRCPFPLFSFPDWVSSAIKSFGGGPPTCLGQVKGGVLGGGGGEDEGCSHVG